MKMGQIKMIADTVTNTRPIIHFDPGKEEKTSTSQDSISRHLKD